ncbi:MAG: ATP synthase subunit C [Candidatus Omnitrophota bacterium]
MTAIFRGRTGISLAFVPGMVMLFWCLGMPGAWAQAVETVRQAIVPAPNNNLAFLSAALAVGMGSVAAGIAVAYVGAASIGAISEKPELVGKVLIFVGLAEGIAIYGLIIAIMILGKV